LHTECKALVTLEIVRFDLIHKNQVRPYLYEKQGHLFFMKRRDKETKLMTTRDRAIELLQQAIEYVNATSNEELATDYQDANLGSDEEDGIFFDACSILGIVEVSLGIVKVSWARGSVDPTSIR
jgi:hypothetical protein